MADSALPPPAEGLEYKSTKDVTIGYTAAAVPHISRSGTALSEDEVKASKQVVGSPAQGNGVPNDNLASVGGLATDSGGVQVNGPQATTPKPQSGTTASADEQLKTAEDNKARNLKS